MAPSIKEGEKLAVVTGATSGIGAAYARLLAERGYELLLTGRRMEKLQTLATELTTSFSVGCRVVEAELSTDAGITELCESLRGLGGIEVLVSNAGFGGMGAFLDQNVERHLEMIRTHDMAAVSLVHAVLPGMLARATGRIVCLSSIASLTPRPRSELYTPSKAFLNAFMQCLDMSYHGSGVRFQALCPGFTHTDFHERLGIATEKQVDRGLIRWMESDRVVAESWRAFEKDRLLVVPGVLNRFLVGLYRLLPRRARRAIAT